MTDHVQLADGWSAWTSVCLRAPGFPVARIADLRSAELPGAVRELSRAIEAGRAANAAARISLQAEPASKPVNKAIKALARGEQPADLAVDLAPTSRDALAAASAAARELAACRERAASTLARESTRIAEALHTVAGSAPFREALLWQNRVAAHGSVAALLRRPADAVDSKTREQRRLVASYLQRYVLKNDTIGFFGPVGWATLSRGDDAVAIAPGPTLLATRRVYFEYWAIDALARVLASDPALRPGLAPRRLATAWVDGTTLIHPNGKRIALPDAAAQLLARMDGERTASELVAEIATPDAVDETFELLAELVEKKLCTWTVELSPQSFTPERDLRHLLERTPAGAREHALARLDRLEVRRDAVARAAGDPAALDTALHELEHAFVELTGQDATRKAGETYAGRGLVFEDCRRSLDARIGGPVLDRLATPLALVLASARWYTYTIASRYEDVFRRVVAELGGGPELDYLRFHERLPEMFPGPSTGIVRDVCAELQATWARILGVAAEPGARSIVLRSQDLRGIVADAFAAPKPGWPSARHQSPDILIAARDVAAIGRGEFTLVLGELHVGLDTIMPCLAKEHPSPDELVRAREHDLPTPNVQPVWSKEINRADFYSESPRDIELERGETKSARPRDHVISLGELVLVAHEDTLVVRTRDHRHRFALTAFLERHLIADSFAAFRLLAPARHVPRITIDDLVVQRETWTFTGPDCLLGFADIADELERLAAALAFADRRGMPTRVYVKTDVEPKPFFADLESPILVDLLVRNLRRASRVTISEMLPTPEDCWLPDADDNRYTSELRMVVVDPVSWTP